MKELVGTHIHQLFVSDDQSILKFVTDKGEFHFKALGDCCSESWFADILFESPSLFFKSNVISVEELVVPEWVNKLACKDNRTRQEYDEVYGFDLKVKNIFGQTSSCHIIFRNSSNGYYGGWCEYCDCINHYDGVWEEITDDWRA